MDRNRLLEILTRVAERTLSTDDALGQLRDLPYQELEFAKIDSHRALRQGIPEVIFCPGKTAEQIFQIASELKANHDVILATRAEPALAQSVLSLSPAASYQAEARMIVWGQPPAPREGAAAVAVVAAGTADLPVAEEAAVMLTASAVPVSRLYDVGVAGIHRLLGNMETLRAAAATIVVAGMDGALPSVVGGLLSGPVIAVPTSVGYGASFEGLAALLTMLNSCAAGICVMNIDNGFGAAVAALRILSQIERHKAFQASGKPAAQRRSGNR